MENDSISSSSSESKLPLIVGIVGIALGAAGLVLALKAKSAADKASSDAATTSGLVAELTGQLSAKANASDVAAISADLTATNQMLISPRTTTKSKLRLRRLVLPKQKLLPQVAKLLLQVTVSTSLLSGDIFRNNCQKIRHHG
jgi:xanthosine utilization system XapX-like protein